MIAGTLPAAFQEAARTQQDRVALRSIDSRYSITWGQLAEAVERAAGALATLGVGQGDRVALLSSNRPELLIADLAAMHLGASTVALYASAPPQAIAVTLSNVAARVLLAERALIEQIPASATEIHPLDGPDSALRHEPPSGFSFATVWRSVRPDQPAAILFTSGTTGLPKGVVWSHRGAVGWAEAFHSCSPEPEHVHDLSLAPFASAAERAGGHWRSLVHGGTRTLCPDPTRLPDALRSARPTFLFGSPRLWQGVLRYLERIASTSTLNEAGLERMRWAITAGASCPTETRRRLIDLGIPLRELYGMTETGGATMTGPSTEDLGTIGCPMPGWKARIGDGGEIQLRAANPSEGYLHAAPNEAFRTDGWVSTGDLGHFDTAGRLRITGRIKDVVVPLSGHNVSPAAIEAELLAACPQIAHACVVGDRRPYLGAIIVLDPAAKDCTRSVEHALQQVNAIHEPRERIENYAVVPDRWQVGEELTETLKLRRDRIAKRYAAEIERLYSSHPSASAAASQ